MDKKFLEDRLRELGIYSDYYHRLELKSLAAFLPYDEVVNCPMVQTNLTVIKRRAVKGWSFTRKLFLSCFSIETDERTFVFSMTQGAREKLFNWAMEQPVKEFEE